VLATSDIRSKKFVADGALRLFTAVLAASDIRSKTGQEKHSEQLYGHLLAGEMERKRA
jgi:hypothetical protein